MKHEINATLLSAVKFV